MKKSQYPASVVKLKLPMVNGTLDIYQVVQKELLPTPAKSHYTFNLRDIGKVFLGMRYAPAGIEDTDKLTRIWAHECLRVFHDRLTNEDDREWFYKMLADMIEKHFKERFGKVFAPITRSTSRADTRGDALRYIMAGDFMKLGADNMQYDEITDENAVFKVMESYLEDYNANTNKPMNLVLFLFAIHHVCRICRVIKQPGGNVLLVGVGGSGRQSLAKLAASIEMFSVSQVELTKSYGMTEWREDLRQVLRKAGELDKRVMFLFSDTQIKKEGFIEDINSLLNTGEVPNLFEQGDVSMIAENVRGRAKRDGREGTRAQLFAYFVDECQRNLRVALVCV
ncbi:hypothetical protein CBR_g34179 [Chara braunii]|uniref:Dynein heavy chain AAA module D4 domain-containing protein n=1 Tax=Chara braunii TaxID=69332 RepID=A0A388LI59_CHABU|nr:hypothetical protein CBR_g34179 [Chara braunii]|eukprot:GBG81999.1 hypothetical protein CBR_g34179 [Chara braunii]